MRQQRRKPLFSTLLIEEIEHAHFHLGLGLSGWNPVRQGMHRQQVATGGDRRARDREHAQRGKRNRESAYVDASEMDHALSSCPPRT